MPHGDVQEEAGQDQEQGLRSHWQIVSWQQSWRSNAISQVAAYQRSASSTLIGSPSDTPVFTNAMLRRFGVLGSVTYQRGPHVLKTGAEASRLVLREDFRFTVTDPAEAWESGLSREAISHTPERPFRFHETAQADVAVFLRPGFDSRDPPPHNRPWCAA